VRELGVLITAQACASVTNPKGGEALWLERYGIYVTAVPATSSGSRIGGFMTKSPVG